MAQRTLGTAGGCSTTTLAGSHKQQHQQQQLSLLWCVCMCWFDSDLTHTDTHRARVSGGRMPSVVYVACTIKCLCRRFVVRVYTLCVSGGGGACGALSKTADLCVVC